MCDMLREMMKDELARATRESFREGFVRVIVWKFAKIIAKLN